MIDKPRLISIFFASIFAAAFIFIIPSWAQITFGVPESPVEERLAEVSSAFSYTSAKPGNSYQAALTVEIKPGWHINSARPFQDWLIASKVEFDTTSELIPYEIIFPPSGTVELLGEKMSVYNGEVNIIFSIRIADSAQFGEARLPVRFTYQACNDKECRAPQTVEDDLIVNIGDEGKPVNADLFAQTDSEPSTAGAIPEDSQQSALGKLIDKYGFWGYLLALGLAYITGLLLSFSPCTYPMIPITVSVFAGQTRSIGRGFFLSLFYVGSMAVMYGIMGLIVSLVGGVFGAWLASPPVVIGIAVIFVIFALSMFGLYELQVPAAMRNKLGATRIGGGVTGSIVLGIIAALVVSPCVGPFVAGILLYIATYGSPAFGFAALFIFAIGLGTLYIILATFSSAINALPGAGMWMESVKKFFGFVLLMMALYFLRTIISASLAAILAGLLLIAFAIFGGGLDRLTAESRFFDRLKKLLGVLALLIGIYLLLGAMLTSGFIIPPLANWMPQAGTSSPTEEKSLIDWQMELDAGLAQAEAEGKPVLIDTWATWCVNCRVLDKKTFGNPDVAAEATRFMSLKIQLEKSNSPETKEFMKRFGLKQYSLPTTLLLDSKGNIRKILQGVVGPEEMLAEMRKIQ